MQFLLVAVLATGAATGAVAQAPVQSASLTLQLALRAAQERSHTLTAQEAAARSAQEMAVNAEQLPDPMLALSIDSLPIEGPMRYSLNDDFMTMRSVGVTQTFTRRDKRRARAAVFEREADTARAARAMALSELRRNTALAWFDRYFQQQMVELLSRQRDEAGLQVEAAEAAFRGERGSQEDFFLARSAVARIEDRIRQTLARLDNATITLARWVGDVASMPLGAAPVISKTRLTPHQLEHQLDQHPDIALMTARETGALAEAEAARQERRVDWSVSLMYSQRGPAYSDMISVGVSVPLQWNTSNRQDRVVASQLAKAAQAQAEREEMIREHLAETRRWLASWRSNLDRLGNYDETLVPLAGQRTRAALAAYRGGQGNLAAVFEAREMEIATRIEHLRIEMETADLWVALEYLTSAEESAAGLSGAPESSAPTTQEQQP